MDTENNTPLLDLTKIKAQALAVITNPTEFFRTMPRGGGLKEPVVFIAAISAVSGLIAAIVALFSSFGGALATLILTPLLTPLFAFIVAAIAMIIWKLMGSQENYETAYRCVAYAAALSPITGMLGLIPYAGGLISAAWGFFLAVIIATEVHAIARQKARLVFGILFGLMAFLGVSSEIATRKVERQMSVYQERLESGEMTPEEAGRMLGDFLKGVQQATEKGKDSGQ